MARIEWARLCELAFLDSYERLCVVGITTQLTAPSLPIALRQLMIAARVVEAKPGETLTIGVSMTTPDALSAAPAPSEGFDVVIAAEYVLITLWNIPFSEAGVHRFVVSLGEEAPMTLELRVVLSSKAPHVPIEGRHQGLTFEQTPRLLGPDVN